MIQKCSRCGCDFITEVDPYIVIPTFSGPVIQCPCIIDRLVEKENSSLKEGFDAGFAEAVRMLKSKIADEYCLGQGDTIIPPGEWAEWLESRRRKK